MHPAPPGRKRLGEARHFQLAAPLERMRMVVMSSVRSSMSRSAPATPTTDGDVDEHGGVRGHGATTGAVSESRYPRPKASTYGFESTSGGVSRKSFRPTRAGFFQIW